MATKNSINSNDPIEVSLGGTGAATLTGVLTGNGTSSVTANTVTQHGVLLGGASNAVSSLGVAASSTVLQGSTGADPSFTATPTVTSITLGSGSALSTFTDWASWTPTVDGAVSGTTTYGTQFGTYMRIGNLVIAQFYVTYTAATGTGNLTIGGLPVTVHNVANYYPMGSVITSASTWPAGATHIVPYGVLTTTTALILATGTAGAGFGLVQMANISNTIYGTLIYRA